MTMREDDTSGVYYARHGDYKERGPFRSDPVAIILGAVLVAVLAIACTWAIALACGVSVPLP